MRIRDGPAAVIEDVLHKPATVLDFCKVLKWEGSECANDPEVRRRLKLNTGKNPMVKGSDGFTWPSEPFFL